MLENNDNKHNNHDFDGITENKVNPPPAYFNVLFYGLIIWGVLFCSYYLLSGWSSGQEFQEKMQAHEATYATSDPVANAPKNTVPPAPASASASASDGEKLFADNCAACHGVKGQGGFGSDLTAGEYAYGKSRDDIRESISAGRGGKMPGFADKLSAGQIDTLVDFLLQL